MAQESEAPFSLRRSLLFFLFFLFNRNFGLLLFNKLDLLFNGADGPFDRLFAGWFRLLWFDNDWHSWRCNLSYYWFGWQERFDEGDFPLLWRLSCMEKAFTSFAIAGRQELIPLIHVVAQHQASLALLVWIKVLML